MDASHLFGRSSPAPAGSAPADPRASHIAALEAQCVLLQSELASLRTRIDPAMILLPPERSGAGSAELEVYWKTPPQEFTQSNCFRAALPQGGFVSTRYIEIPPDSAGHLRIDPGNQPGLWLFTEITLHHLDPEGALMQPPVAIWNPRNGFAGLVAARGAIILPTLKSGPHPACRILTWESDPQLLLPLPKNPDRRTRILGIVCAVLDPAHAIMAQNGQQLLDQIAALKDQNTELQTQLNAAPRHGKP